MRLYALFYDVVDNYVSRRSQFRAEHLRLGEESYRRGELLLGGALDEPMDRALIVFRSSRDDAERFAANDPYVINGLVRHWEVRQWNVVVGAIEEES